MTTAFGIDIGGSGIKGALVDLDKGVFIGERLRIPTPQPSTPDAVATVCAQIAQEFEIGEDIPIGIDFPAPLPDGKVPWMANLDQSWVGKNLADVMEQKIGRRVHVLNDADAAGLAEMRYGVGKNYSGVVVVTTLGTGIGSALFVDGTLVPNTEFGHIEVGGKDAEKRAAASVRKKKNLSWEEWASRLERYYGTLEKMLWPSAIIVGGGVSRKHDKFLPLISISTPLVPAQLRNTAGIVGAAAYAFEREH
ncbi:MAG: ROK family protein [Actinomycetaceae bacterium]|nr:ROK family protein [Actinomycetaceae bacterium]